MKTFILSGSHRESGETHKVSGHIERVLRRRGHDVFLYSLAGNPLPFWTDDSNESATWRDVWRPVAVELKKCDSIIIATPEWCGMATPGVKNFFLFLDGELRHKPGLIVTTSAALNGVYPVAELRSVATKNNQICFIPEHIIVRNVEHVLDRDGPAPAEEQEDRSVRERFEYALDMLEAYADALALARSDQRLASSRYPYGM
jgi:NAD(P)H-dependent FMN reductase